MSRARDCLAKIVFYASWCSSKLEEHWWITPAIMPIILIQENPLKNLIFGLLLIRLPLEWLVTDHGIISSYIVTVSCFTIIDHIYALYIYDWICVFF